MRDSDNEPRPKLSVIIATFNNAEILERCINSWKLFASNQNFEILVIADGCRDNTLDVLNAFGSTKWGKQHLRTFSEDNVHELLCTNRGINEARGELILSWHDDMFLTSYFFVPELIRFLDENQDVGLLGLCRGLQCKKTDLPATWEELTFPDRLESTIGPKIFNWFQFYEVDAVMRPWITRKSCIEKVGALDEAYKLSEWDEADFCFRLNRFGWKIATHAFERLGAYKHLGSSTISKTASDAYKQQVLKNGQLFYTRWGETIKQISGRRRQKWNRRFTLQSLLFTLKNLLGDTIRRSYRKFTFRVV